MYIYRIERENLRQVYFEALGSASNKYTREAVAVEKEQH